MDTEKLNEFKALIQTFIDANGEQIFGKRVYWKNFPDKIAVNAAKNLKIPESESVMMIIDASIMGSGKDGMALTDWGIRYNDGADSWNVSWSDLSEKYSFEESITDGVLGMKVDVLLLQAKPGDDIVVTKKVSMSMADIKYDLLARLISKVCQIFTGKNVDILKPAINDVPAPDPKVEPRPEAEPAQTTKVPEELTPAQKREKERWRKEDARDREALDNLRNGISDKTGSFLSENMGGVIMTALILIMGEVTILGMEEITGGAKLLAFILLIIIAAPLTLLGCFLGNKLRLMLHPDFVIADGFMGLLKEKIFWRFGPQLIGALLGYLIGYGIVGMITGKIVG